MVLLQAARTPTPGKCRHAPGATTSGMRGWMFVLIGFQGGCMHGDAPPKPWLDVCARSSSIRQQAVSRRVNSAWMVAIGASTYALCGAQSHWLLATGATCRMDEPAKAGGVLVRLKSFPEHSATNGWWCFALIGSAAAVSKRIRSCLGPVIAEDRMRRGIGQ